jgi:hypothetical protein
MVFSIYVYVFTYKKNGIRIKSYKKPTVKIKVVVIVVSLRLSGRDYVRLLAVS